MNIITDTFIQKLKKKAKLECKTSPYSLTQIQDELVRKYGYPNWRTFISRRGDAAVSVDDAELWFRTNFSAGCNHGMQWPSIEEPSDIFEAITSEFGVSLAYEDGGRLAQLADELSCEDRWISERFFAEDLEENVYE